MGMRSYVLGALALCAALALAACGGDSGPSDVGARASASLAGRTAPRWAR